MEKGKCDDKTKSLNTVINNFDTRFIIPTWSSNYIISKL